MARTKDITSTEKLLNVIRSKKDEPVAPVKSPEPRDRKKGLSPVKSLKSLPSMASLQKKGTVGVDIGHDYLRLVRAARGSDGEWQILDRRRLALPPDADRDTPRFSSFLKASLASFCGSAKQNLWTTMSTDRVDVRHIRVPKVPKKQLGNVVYWTLKKEAPVDEKETVFDFESQGEVIEQGIAKQAVMVYSTPRQEIEDLKDLFSRIGWPLTGITIVPFSVQNLFRTGWIPAVEGTIASLHIGNDFSRIDIYAGGNLVMTRGIKAGLTSMAEAVVDCVNEMKASPDAAPLMLEQGHKIIRSLSPDSLPLEKTDSGAELSGESVCKMIEPALERLARQVERTFEHYAVTMPGNRISRIFMSSDMNIYQPIVDYVGNQLGIPSAVLDPLSGQAEDACVDVDDTNCVSERVAFAPALGLALSARRLHAEPDVHLQGQEPGGQCQPDQPGGLRGFHSRPSSSVRASSSTRTGPSPARRLPSPGSRRRWPVSANRSTGTSS